MSLARLLLAVVVISGLLNADAALCSYGQYRVLARNYGTKEYFTIPVRYAWQYAAGACRMMGGTLASMHSPEENEFLYRLVGDTVAAYPGLATSGGAAAAWFGLAVTSATVGAYDDGTPFDFQNWATSEPDFPSAYYGMPSCAVMGNIQASTPTGVVYSTGGSWGDTRCDANMYFPLCARPVSADGGCSGDVPSGPSQPPLANPPVVDPPVVDPPVAGPPVVDPPGPNSPPVVPGSPPVANPPVVDPPSKPPTIPGADIPDRGPSSPKRPSPPRPQLPVGTPTPPRPPSRPKKSKKLPVILSAVGGVALLACIGAIVDHFTTRFLRCCC